MDLVLNNLQRLICHKTHETKPTKPKRITQTQPTPIITPNKFEEIEEMEIENKTPINKSQPKKSQKSKLNE